MTKLTAKEEEIMGLFWEKGPLFVKQLQELYDEPRPHFNTLSTIVRTLEDKGYLGHTVFGTTHQYHAMITAEEYNRGTLHGVVHKYFNNSYKRVVSALIEEENISIDELRSLIKEVENKQKN
jgi:BlaI family penicillinase repressor